MGETNPRNKGDSTLWLSTEQTSSDSHTPESDVYSQRKNTKTFQNPLILFLGSFWRRKNAFHTPDRIFTTNGESQRCSKRQIPLCGISILRPFLLLFEN
mmetsp:Transcript_43147/g.50481  ORF Transcript_43147/g.50481 Transcript_43147/m.50481 type:complete len:99 (-) Transcript_43147:439-735(-)